LQRNLEELNPGKNPPTQINVVVEIPQDSSVKYEMDSKTEAIYVDRFLYTASYFPFNYGFIPSTIEDDGDPVDVGVLSQHSVFPTSVIRARPIAVLLTEDERGPDPKVIAAPSIRRDPYYALITDLSHIPSFTTHQIEDFFRRYKELEPRKFVKIIGWKRRKQAEDIIRRGIEAHRKLAKNHLTAWLDEISFSRYLKKSSLTFPLASLPALFPILVFLD
jgi:inorganic pyrophosphatase